MTTASVKHFDVLDFVDKSKELGVNEEVAKYQARAIEQAIDIAVNTVKHDIDDKELATRGDVRESELRLQKEIKEIETRLIKWVVGTGATTILSIAGLIKYMH